MRIFTFLTTKVMEHIFMEIFILIFTIMKKIFLKNPIRPLFGNQFRLMWNCIRSCTIISLKQLIANPTLASSSRSSFFHQILIIFPEKLFQQKIIDVGYLIIKLFIEWGKCKKIKNYVADMFEQVYSWYLRPKGLKANLIQTFSRLRATCW